MTDRRSKLSNYKEGGNMANEPQKNYQSSKRPQAKKLPDLSNEKTYRKLLRIAEQEVRQSRRIRLARIFRLHRI